MQELCSDPGAPKAIGVVTWVSVTTLTDFGLKSKGAEKEGNRIQIEKRKKNQSSSTGEPNTQPKSLFSNKRNISPFYYHKSL